jgi:hypothetical protein
MLMIYSGVGAVKRGSDRSRIAGCFRPNVADVMIAVNDERKVSDGVVDQY